LAGLKLQCEEVLLSSLDVNNMSELLELSDTFHLSTLRPAIISYITRNFKTIFPTKTFKEMCSKSPHLFAEIHDAVYPDPNKDNSSPDESNTEGKKAAKKKRKR